MINNIFDYLGTYGNCFKKFHHDDKRIVTIKWQEEAKFFTVSWIENETILTGILKEEQIYKMLNNDQLIEIK